MGDKWTTSGRSRLKAMQKRSHFSSGLPPRHNSTLFDRPIARSQPQRTRPTKARANGKYSAYADPILRRAVIGELRPSEKKQHPVHRTRRIRDANQRRILAHYNANYDPRTDTVRPPPQEFSEHNYPQPPLPLQRGALPHRVAQANPPSLSEHELPYHQHMNQSICYGPDLSQHHHQDFQGSGSLYQQEQGFQSANIGESPYKPHEPPPTMGMSRFQRHARHPVSTPLDQGIPRFQRPRSEAQQLEFGNESFHHHGIPQEKGFCDHSESFTNGQVFQNDAVGDAVFPPVGVHGGPFSLPQCSETTGSSFSTNDRPASSSNERGLANFDFGTYAGDPPEPYFPESSQRTGHHDTQVPRLIHSPQTHGSGLDRFRRDNTYNVDSRVEHYQTHTSALASDDSKTSGGFERFRKKPIAEVSRPTKTVPQAQVFRGKCFLGDPSPIRFFSSKTEVALDSKPLSRPGSVEDDDDESLLGLRGKTSLWG